MHTGSMGEGDSSADATMVGDGVVSRTSVAPIHARLVLGSSSVEGSDDGGDGYGEGRWCRAIRGRDEKAGQG